MIRPALDAPDPPVLERPKLARWMFDRGLKPKDAAPWLEVTAQTVRRWCLPFGDAERRVPTEDDLKRIIHWTGGDVTAEDFYRPELTRRSDPQPSEASA